MKQINFEYLDKFPDPLKNALKTQKITFPNTIQYKYDAICVYRGVKYTKEKPTICKTDFFSYVELHNINPMFVADDTDTASYSCSCYMDIEKMRFYTKFPTKNKAIAKGIICDKFGPIDINNETTHIDLYLYDNIDPSNNFEVIEKWEKNGLN